MKKKLTFSIASLLVLSGIGIARAQIYITADIGGVPNVSGATLVNFDGPTPSIVTLSGPAYFTTGTSSLGSAPVFSGSTAAYFGESPATGPDNSQYVAVDPGGSATFSFSTPQHYFGLVWGTIDPYAGMNVLTFYDNANNVIGAVQGGDVIAANGSLNPGDTAYVNIMSTTAFSSVVATATPIFPEAFEFDDVAYLVPEPGSSVLFGAGVCVLGLMLRGKFAKSAGIGLD